MSLLRPGRFVALAVAAGAVCLAIWTAICVARAIDVGYSHGNGQQPKMQLERPPAVNSSWQATHRAVWQFLNQTQLESPDFSPNRSGLGYNFDWEVQQASIGARQLPGAWPLYPEQESAEGECGLLTGHSTSPLPWG